MRTSMTSVLIVDDDEDIRTNVSDILCDLGYQTSTAADGPTALELVRQYRFDIALLDMKMPGMDGLTLYRNIRSLQPNTAAFLVTAFAGDGVAEDALRAGIRQVVRKPVDFPEILRSIGSVVD